MDVLRIMGPKWN